MSNLQAKPVYPEVERIKFELIPLLKDATFFVSWTRKEGPTPARFDIPEPARVLFGNLWQWFIEQAGDNNSTLKASLMHINHGQTPRTGTDIHPDAWTEHKKLVNFSDLDSNSGTLTFPDHTQGNAVRYASDLFTRAARGQLLRTSTAYSGQIITAQCGEIVTLASDTYHAQPPLSEGSHRLWLSSTVFQ